MKTDIELFIDLYKRIGVDVLPLIHYRDTPNRVSIILGDNRDQEPKITGYLGFITDIVFDLDGKFIEQGMWE